MIPSNSIRWKMKIAATEQKSPKHVYDTRYLTRETLLFRRIIVAALHAKASQIDDRHG